MSTATRERTAMARPQRLDAAPLQRLGVSVQRLAPAVITASAILGAYLIFALVVPHGVAYPQGRVFGLLNWDGGWYNLIAGQGYTRINGPFQPIAFYPGFPFLVRAVHEVLPFVRLQDEGIAINVVLAVSAACLVDRAVATWPTRTRVALVALLLTVPAAMFYVAFYSESLFLFAFALAVWAYQRPSRVLWAALAVLIGSVARSVGILLVVPLVVTLWRHRPELRPATMAAGVAVSVAGIVATPLLDLMLTGDPLAYQHAQAVWIDHFSVMTASQAVQTVVTALLFQPAYAHNVASDLGIWEALLTVPATAYVLIRWPRWRPLTITAAVMFAVDLVDGGWVSQLRYIAVLVPLWVGLFALVGRKPWGRYAIPVAIVAGFALNLYFLQRFVTGQPMV